MEEQKGKNKNVAADENKFTKEQLLKSERYKNRRDILSVVLCDGESYSHNEAESEIEKFLKGKVN
ncbi:MAG: hypothetical protein HFE62_04570 [Firmicutes bacterium]|nr:hypothetical protein [Bacillota bacterium]